MNVPLVSVIIPAFNSAGTIAATLESVRAQTWPEIEIVVIDDGSSDATAEQVEKARLHNLRLVRQENQGACAARNAGMAVASGEYIQFLDADDLLHENKIRDQVNRLMTLPAGHVAYGPWDYMDTAGAYAGEGLATGEDLSPGWRLLAASLKRGFFVAPHSWLVPRAVLEKAGSWDQRLVQNQDGEYFARVLEHAQGVAWVESARCYYRRHLAASVSQVRGEAADRSLLMAAESIAGRLRSFESADRHLASAAYLRALYRVERNSKVWAALWRRAGEAGLPGRSIGLGGPVFRALYRTFGWRIAFECRACKLMALRRLGVEHRR